MKCPKCGYENREDARYCNLCTTIFKKQAPAQAPASPAAAAKPGLDYRKIAEDFVAKSGPNDPFLGGFGIVLDYSPASVHAIDEFINFTWGTKGESPDTEDYRPASGKSLVIVQFGCYFGEVIRRLTGGRWEPDPKQLDNPLSTALAVNDLRIFPIAKSFRRMKNGVADAMSPLMFELLQALKLDMGGKVADGFLRQAEAFFNKSALPEARRLHLGHSFAKLAMDLNPKLTSPVLAAIFEAVNNADPAALEEALLSPLDIIDFEEASSAIARGRYSLGLTLDYSLPALAVLDLSTGGDIQSDTWALGCYTGETLRRSLNGKWKQDMDDKLKSVVVLADGTSVNPFQWVAERGERTFYERVPHDAAKDREWFRARAAELVEANNDTNAVKLFELAGDHCECGFALVRLRRFDDALESFNKVETSEAWDGRAAALAGLVKNEDALAACDRAIELDAKNAAAHCRRGDLLRASSRNDEALATYETAIRLNKRCAPALLAKGELLLEKGNPADALKILRAEVLKRAKESSSAWHRVGLCVDRQATSFPGHKADPCRGAAVIEYFKALCCDKLDDFRQAAIYFQFVVKYPPAGHESMTEDARKRLEIMQAFQKAQELMRGDNREEFIQAASAALEMDGSRLNMRREMGVGYAMLERYEESLQALDENLAIDPNHLLTIANKATVLSKMGRLEDAVAEYERALALDPADRSSWRNKAVCLRDLQPPERFANFLDETLAADPHHELAWNVKAFAEIKAGRNEAGAQCLRKFIENVKPDTNINLINEAQRTLWKLDNPDQPVDTDAAAALFEQGGRLGMSMNFAGAVPILQRALAMDPLYAPGWQNLATCLAFMEQFEDAIECVEQACRLDPRDKDAWKMRGQILVQMGRREDAAVVWQRITTWWPKVSDCWQERAWNCNHLCRFDEAIQCFDECLKVDPANRELALRKASVLDRAGRHEEALEILQSELSEQELVDDMREKGQAEFDYLISRESSPEFVKELKQVFQ